MHLCFLALFSPSTLNCIYNPCEDALCKGHARLHASASLQLQRGQTRKYRRPPSLSKIDCPPSYTHEAKSQRQGFMQGNLPPLLFSISFNLLLYSPSTNNETHTESTQYFQDTQHIHSAGDYIDVEVRIHLIRGTGGLEG